MSKNQIGWLCAAVVAITAIIFLAAEMRMGSAQKTQTAIDLMMQPPNYNPSRCYSMVHGVWHMWPPRASDGSCYSADDPMYNSESIQHDNADVSAAISRQQSIDWAAVIEGARSNA